ncbi:hypothetical protein HWV62_26364 [Athelia sp. TMB]|nr:hypothetical protein HWV62_26364 [Athelia sp. TMB]
MTEYTSSPDAVEEYLTSKERTARWLRQNPPGGFVSPSMPPSELGDFGDDRRTIYGSEAESVRSVPPKMVLKFGDGRADLPISHWHYNASGEPLPFPRSKEASGSRSQPRGVPTDHRHRRSRSEAPQLRPGSRFGAPVTPPARHYPEEIRILPSQSKDSPSSSSRAPPHTHQRSKSQPRGAPPAPQPHHPRPSEPYPRPEPVSYSHSHPMYRPYGSRYAEQFTPALNAPRPLYTPAPVPKNYYPSPIIHPGTGYGAIPAGSRYPQGISTAFPTARNGLGPVTEDMLPPRSKTAAPREDSRARKGSRWGRSRSPSPPRTSLDSERTYFHMPNPNQKVQILAPDRSLYTATSATQSPMPSPPPSSTSKKPFFSRFFHFGGGGDKSAPSSNASRASSERRRLHRRHSTGAGGRPVIPITTH